MQKKNIYTVIIVFSVFLASVACVSAESNADGNKVTLTYISNGANLPSGYREISYSETYDVGDTVTIATKSVITGHRWSTPSAFEDFYGWSYSYNGELVYKWDNTNSKILKWSTTGTATVGEDGKISVLNESATVGEDGKISIPGAVEGTAVTYTVNGTTGTATASGGKISVPGAAAGTAVTYTVNGTTGTATVDEDGKISVLKASATVSGGKISVPGAAAGTAVAYTVKRTASVGEDGKISVPGAADGTAVAYTVNGTATASGGKISIPGAVNGTTVTYTVYGTTGTTTVSEDGKTYTVNGMATVSGGKISIPGAVNGTVVTYTVNGTTGTATVSGGKISVPGAAANAVVTYTVYGTAGTATVSGGKISVPDAADGTAVAYTVYRTAETEGGKLSIPGAAKNTTVTYTVNGTATVGEDGKISVPGVAAGTEVTYIADGTEITYVADGTTGQGTVSGGKITVGADENTTVFYVADGTEITYVIDGVSNSATVSGGKITVGAAEGTVVTYNVNSWVESPTFIITQNTKLYAVWSPFEVTIHQPVEYGSIDIQASTAPVHTSNYHTGTTMHLTFQSISSKNGTELYTPYYWVVNGVKCFYGQNAIDITITSNTEVSIFVNGQVTDINELPKNFQAVEYIENYGGAYIDTGYTPNYMTKIKAKYTVSVDSGKTFALYGSRPTGSYEVNTLTYWVCAGGTNMRYDYGVAGTPESSTYKLDNTYEIVSYKNESSVIINKGKEGEKQATLKSTYTDEFYTANPLYIFRMNGNGFSDTSKIESSIRLYSFTIYEGPDEEHMTFERNFIPCIFIGEDDTVVDSTGAYIKTWAIGMYDTVYGQFYSRADYIDKGFIPELIAGPYGHTIGFQTLGGEKRQEVITYQNLSDLETITVNPPYSPTGKSFRGYYLNGTTKVFDENGRYVPNSLSIETDYVLTDTWEDVYISFYRNLSGDLVKKDSELIETVGPTYTVTMGSLPDREVTEGGATKVYRFRCWSDVNGNSYESGETVEFGVDTDLFAIWKQDTEHTLTYHYNDGTGKSIKIVGNRVDAVNGPERSGYEFAYWISESEPDEPIYPGDEITLTEDMDLYAQWRYTIVFNRCGGYDGTAQTSFVGTDITSHIDPPEREGASFYGYASQSGTMYYNSEGNSIHAWDIPMNATLEAIWSITVTIHTSDTDYNPGTGWTQVDGQPGVFQKSFVGKYEAIVILPLTDPSVNAGYVFLGWERTSVHLPTGGTESTSTPIEYSALVILEIYSATFSNQSV